MKDYDDVYTELKGDDPHKAPLSTVICVNIVQVLFFGVWSLFFWLYTFKLEQDCSEANLLKLGAIFCYINLTLACAVFLAGLTWVVIRLGRNERDVGDYVIAGEILTILILAFFTAIYGWYKLHGNPQANGCQGLYYVLIIYMILYSVGLGMIISMGLLKILEAIILNFPTIEMKKKNKSRKDEEKGEDRYEAPQKKPETQAAPPPTAEPLPRNVTPSFGDLDYVSQTSSSWNSIE
jgi:hypothetical protein